MFMAVHFLHNNTSVRCRLNRDVATTPTSLRKQYRLAIFDHFSILRWTTFFMRPYPARRFSDSSVNHTGTRLSVPRHVLVAVLPTTLCQIIPVPSLAPTIPETLLCLVRRYSQVVCAVIITCVLNYPSSIAQ